MHTETDRAWPQCHAKVRASERALVCPPLLGLFHFEKGAESLVHRKHALSAFDSYFKLQNTSLCVCVDNKSVAVVAAAAAEIGAPIPPAKKIPSFQLLH